MDCRILPIMLAISACFACDSGQRPRVASVRRTPDASFGDRSMDASFEAGAGATDAAADRRSEAGPDATDASVGACIIGDDASECSNGLCRIRAGSFTMGAPRDEPFSGAFADVQVSVQVSRDFWIGQSEVTLAEWRAAGFPDPIPDWRRTGSPTADAPPSGYSECTDPTCPVVWMNYEDAMAYANRRSEQKGLPACYQLTDCAGEPGRYLRCKTVSVNAPTPYECLGYRLPTEAEWEYAARAGSQTAFFSGDISTNLEDSVRCLVDPPLDRIGWYCANAIPTRNYENGGGHPFPAKRKCANAWGLYDTAGNAMEWVNDIFDPEGYGKGPFVDPVFGVTDARDLTPVHPTYGAEGKDRDGYVLFRSHRGGTFDLSANFAKVSTRTSGGVGGQHSGFRIARTAPSAPKAARTND
jgi:formylglycine-generating enzyme